VTESDDHSASPSVLTLKVLPTHSAIGGGSGFLLSGLVSGAISGSSGTGNWPLPSFTTGWASISAAWFSVKPVTAKSSSPTRLSAEAIQCQV
jgi:hypothetical protein